MALDEIMGELAQYMRMQEEITQTVESLKDQLKQAMNAAGQLNRYGLADNAGIKDQAAQMLYEHRNIFEEVTA